MSNPWSAFYWGDYIADTGHLTLAQHGAYLLLMAHYYRTRRPLPANAAILHRVCRCTTDADKSAVNDVLAEFFAVEDDVYRHHRIDRELAKATDVSEKRRAAANAKHQKDRAANALQMHTQSQPQSQPESDSQSQPTPDSPSLENQFVYSKEKQYSQADFDARDIRKLSDAFNKIQSFQFSTSGHPLSEKQVFELACEEAGISVQRGLEVQKLGKKWPVQAVGASA